LNQLVDFNEFGIEVMSLNANFNHFNMVEVDAISAPVSLAQQWVDW
jgi:hypothetical protein